MDLSSPQANAAALTPKREELDEFVDARVSYGQFDAETRAFMARPIYTPNAGKIAWVVVITAITFALIKIVWSFFVQR